MATTTWDEQAKREIDKRVDAVIARGGLLPEDEMWEYVEAPDGKRYWFVVSGVLEDRALDACGVR